MYNISENNNKFFYINKILFNKILFNKILYKKYHGKKYKL